MDKDQRNTIIEDAICAYLKEGMYKKDAAIMAGIDESTLYRWIEADASFASRVEASILEYKHSLVQNINTQAKIDGRLALELLKRRFPNDNSEEKNDMRASMDRIVDAMDRLLAAPDEETDMVGQFS